MNETATESAGAEALMALGILILILAAIVLTLWFLRKRVAIIGEFIAFLWERKLWWMMPIMFMFLLLVVVIVLSQQSAIAPFIYTLF